MRRLNSENLLFFHNLGKPTVRAYYSFSWASNYIYDFTLHLYCLFLFLERTVIYLTPVVKWGKIMGNLDKRNKISLLLIFKLMTILRLRFYFPVNCGGIHFFLDKNSLGRKKNKKTALGKEWKPFLEVLGTYHGKWY